VNEPHLLVILTAPSGSGKTTIVRHLLAHHPELAFSVSACTREPRAGEIEGRDYYFLTPDAFRKKIAEKAFAEFEMVYTEKYYGTLLSELDRIWNSGHTPLIDIDVKGALTLKSRYPGKSFTLFIQPPSLPVLEERLKARGTETPAMLTERINKALMELNFADRFDRILVNNNLEQAKSMADQMVKDFLNRDR